MRAFITVLSLSFLFQSCTEEIPFDLNSQGFDRLVVEGSITNQAKAHQVKLTKTSSYFDDEPTPVVSGATVKISNSLQEWTLTETPPGSGIYLTPSDAAGFVGLSHILTIEHEGEEYTAVDYLNPVSELDSVMLAQMEPDFFDDEDDVDLWWGMTIWTVETPNEINFYRWRTLVNGVSFSDTIRNSSFANDVGFDGAILDDYVLEGFDLDRIDYGDTLTLEQHGISEDYYDMMSAALNQTELEGGLFDPPPANVPTNLTGGALGFFSASSVSEKTIIVQ